MNNFLLSGEIESITKDNELIVDVQNSKFKFLLDTFDSTTNVKVGKIIQFNLIGLRKGSILIKVLPV